MSTGHGKIIEIAHAGLKELEHTVSVGNTLAAGRAQPDSLADCASGKGTAVSRSWTQPGLAENPLIYSFEFNNYPEVTICRLITGARYAEGNIWLP
jgi:hypothetical protein